MSRIEELEKRLAADPNSRIFVQLAEEYRKAGLLEQAIEVCEEGIKKHPQYPSARVALGRALLEAESFDRASAEFEAVLKQVPDNILANKFLGETYHRLGRLDEALRKYQVARTLAPEDLELGERLDALQAEIASGGAAPAPPSAPETPQTPAPPAVPPPPMTPSSAAPAESQASPPPPKSFTAPELDETVEDAEATYTEIDDDLPPIPLVDVDEPMVLEDRFAAPPVPGSPAPAPPEPQEPPAAPELSGYEPVPPPLEPEPPSFEALQVEHFGEPESSSFVEPMLEPDPVAPAAPPPSTPPPPSATAADIETRTMAELYAAQGHLEQAIAVYDKLLERRPDEIAYRSRVDELRMLVQATRESRKSPPATTAPAAPAVDDVPRAAAPESGPEDRTVEVLSGWLQAIKKSRGD